MIDKSDFLDSLIYLYHDELATCDNRLAGVWIIVQLLVSYLTAFGAVMSYDCISKVFIAKVCQSADLVENLN